MPHILKLDSTKIHLCLLTLSLPNITFRKLSLHHRKCKCRPCLKYSTLSYGHNLFWKVYNSLAESLNSYTFFRLSILGLWSYIAWQTFLPEIINTYCVCVVLPTPIISNRPPLHNIKKVKNVHINISYAMRTSNFHHKMLRFLGIIVWKDYGWH